MSFLLGLKSRAPKKITASDLLAATKNATAKKAATNPKPATEKPAAPAPKPAAPARKPVKRPAPKASGRPIACPHCGKSDDIAKKSEHFDQHFGFRYDHLECRSCGYVFSSRVRI